MPHLCRSMAFLVLLGPWLSNGQSSALRAGEPKPRLMPVPQSRKAPPVKLGRTATLLEHLSDALRLRKPEEALRLAKALPKGTRARNREGEPLLLVATQRGYLEVVATMLDRGVPVDGPALFGTTALMVAAAWNHDDLVDLLLTKGASLRARDANGDGAFCYAVAADNPASLERMRVQDPGCLTRESKLVGSLFRHAAEYSLPKSLAWLLDHLGVPTGDELRETLEEALAQEDLIILANLLDRGVPVESPTTKDSTLLLGAVRVTTWATWSCCCNGAPR